MGLARIHVEPKSMDVLQALVEHAGEVRPKADLIAAVWGDAFVSDEVLTHAIWDLRRSLGDNASDPEFIQTIPKRGYRLIAPVTGVEEEEEGEKIDAGTASPSSPALPLGRRIVGLALASGLAVGTAIAALLLATGSWGSIPARLGAFADVVTHDRFFDPDMDPWFSLWRDDIRAVDAFLLGVDYVYRNEVEGRHAMLSAMLQDPGFVAPRVWHAPYIANHGDPDEIAARVSELEALFATATSFQKAMIRWAVTVLQKRPAGNQIRHLENALNYEPGNRQVRLTLALLRHAAGAPERAWPHYAEILRSGWDFPALFPLAAECAAELRDLDGFRAALAPAGAKRHVDPKTHRLLALLAAYDESPEDERRHLEDYAQRLPEMAPEVPDTDVRAVAAWLASLAEEQGRGTVAARIVREFSD